MSRASRPRRGKQSSRSGRRPDLVVVRGAEEPCGCPACSGEEPDPGQLLAELVDAAADLAGREDPLEAELAGALFVAALVGGDDDDVSAFAGAFIPAIEARGGDAALMMLTAIGAAACAGPEPVAKAAVAAAGRLAAGGIPVPPWARELEQPVVAGSFARLYDTDGSMSVLAGSFRRAGREHALILAVDHGDCGAAQDIVMLDAAELPAALDDIRDRGRREGLIIKTQTLAAPEFRWHVEQAMRVRAEHDAENGDDDGPDEADLLDEEHGPGYPVLAVLARARLDALPPPRQPRGAVVSGHGPGGQDALVALQQLVSMVARSSGRSAVAPGFPTGRAQPAKLPAKRRKTAGPAPVYQIKVSLRGAKPPIWRRLLVPADITLARLHTTVLAAFDWHGGHMHAFETPFGTFGRADRELGHRADGSVTLEQVAPQEKDKIRYTYDFGDDWAHDIVVEKVLDHDATVAYPRCTGGKRAAPPDDCGGLWGYAELVEVLADPSHPEHGERLEWLGLTDASQFAPDAFDAEEVNRRLGALR
ncbi:plasmid pRiA4b ORF-3 family protein [Dactylosporangium sp. CA-092794]|uniref:plasmid pRiA4b ORF-3 family protein n=1 Tax=Dactylosporangium sp. CA-092794 TaxID=3239929 RepID=UPI003D9413B4